MRRKIGQIEGKQGDVLLIAIGQMHGNEPTGIQALEKLFSHFETFPPHQISSLFEGKIVGLRGNRQAAAKGERYLKSDLNRLWKAKNVQRILQSPPSNLEAEEKELYELEAQISEEIRLYEPKTVFILDFHTTTADGGEFSIPIDTPLSEQIGNRLHAPVIHGLAENLPGTLIEYAGSRPWKVDTHALAYEAGQHQSVQAEGKAFIALLQAIISLGMSSLSNMKDILPSHEIHDSPPPLIGKIVHIHKILPGDEFEMLPGFKNFVPVKQGQLLARDRHGEILSPFDSHMLMPLYQKQGDDGFFLIKKEPLEKFGF
ncbi:MAG: succinylglutamate desuccinylase/aspartoacylase family protein [Bacteroidota bacterium]